MNRRTFEAAMRCARLPARAQDGGFAQGVLWRVTRYKVAASHGYGMAFRMQRQLRRGDAFVIEEDGYGAARVA